MAWPITGFPHCSTTSSTPGGPEPVAALGVVTTGATTPSGRPKLCSIGANSMGLVSTWIKVAVLLLSPRTCKARLSKPSSWPPERSGGLIGSVTSNLKLP